MQWLALAGVVATAMFFDWITFGFSFTKKSKPSKPNLNIARVCVLEMQQRGFTEEEITKVVEETYK